MADLRNDFVVDVQLGFEKLISRFHHLTSEFARINAQCERYETLLNNVERENLKLKQEIEQLKKDQCPISSEKLLASGEPGAGNSMSI